MNVATKPERVVVVTRRTELEELVARFNTTAQAEFYLRSAGRDFTPIRAAHERYQAALARLRHALPDDLKHVRIDRSDVPQFDFRADIVVAIGQDGLVSNTAKYLDGQPLLGVNPDPELHDGVLLPWRPETVAEGLRAARAGGGNVEAVTLALAAANDGRRLLAFNDLFIGPASHGSARYIIQHAERSERQSSSGVIVSTGAGSTGWLASVHRGACAVASALGYAAPPPPENGRFPRTAEKLVFSVREPWPSRNTGASLVYGEISAERRLRIASQMPAGGVIFSDGVESDYLEFNAGSEVTVSVSPQKTRLLLP